VTAGAPCSSSPSPPPASVFLSGLLFIPLILLSFLGVGLAIFAPQHGPRRVEGRLRLGQRPPSDPAAGQELEFESRASQILGLKVEAEVQSGPYRPDHHHHKVKIMGVTVSDEIHEEPHTRRPRSR